MHMHKTTFVGLVCFLLIGLICLSHPFPAAAENIKWYAYDKGLALGKAQKKKVFLHFWAEWCDYCTKMAQDSFKDAKVVAYINTNFIPIKIDFDRKRRLATDYAVRGLPNTYFLKADGEIIGNLPGYIPSKMLYTILKYIYTDSYKKMSLQKYMDRE